MYHFGMLITDQQMRPLPRVFLEAAAPKLKARYNTLGCECAVFVLTERQYPAQYIRDFGFPVNVVVSSDHHPGWGFLSENVYDILKDISCEVFPVPYIKQGFWEDALMLNYGLFLCDRNLNPVSRNAAVKIVRLMAAEYCDIGWPCKAYVLGGEDILLDAATEFGAPVNAVLTSEQYVTERCLRNNMSIPNDVLAFILPLYGGADQDPLANPELGKRLLDTDITVTCLIGAYEVPAPDLALTD